MCTSGQDALMPIKHRTRKPETQAVESINLSLSASESFFRDCVIATATVASFLFALTFALVNTRKRSAPPAMTSDFALCLEGLIQA